MSVPDNLKAIEKKVADNADLKQSATALCQGVADELDKLTQDPVAIKALAKDLRDYAEVLGAAVLHNTDVATSGAAPSQTPSKAPAAPPPPPPSGPPTPKAPGKPHSK